MKNNFQRKLFERGQREHAKGCNNCNIGITSLPLKIPFEITKLTKALFIASDEEEAEKIKMEIFQKVLPFVSVLAKSICFDLQNMGISSINLNDLIEVGIEEIFCKICLIQQKQQTVNLFAFTYSVWQRMFRCITPNSNLYNIFLTYKVRQYLSRSGEPADNQSMQEFLKGLLPEDPVVFEIITYALNSSSADAVLEELRNKNMVSLEKDPMSTETQAIQNIIFEKIQELLEEYKNKKTLTMLDMYLKGYSFEEIGQRFGCKRQNVDQCLRYLFKYLRRGMLKFIFY